MKTNPASATAKVCILLSQASRGVFILKIVTMAYRILHITCSSLIELPMEQLCDIYEGSDL